MEATIKAVQTVRSLGGDTSEEFQAFREAMRKRHFQRSLFWDFTPAAIDAALERLGK